MESQEELDLIKIAKVLWNQRKMILVVSSLFVIIGITASLMAPFVYTSSTTFIPASKETSSRSSLSGVASLVGINLGGVSSASDIPPQMYPQVSESMRFKRMLLEKFVDEKKSTTLKEFLYSHYEIKEKYERKSALSFVSDGEDELFQLVDELLSISVNQKDGFVTINVNMPNAEYAANTCINARDLLQKIIIDNRIKSAKFSLEYSEKQLNEKSIEFEAIQNKLANFNDSNLNIINSKVLNEKEKIEAEYEIINAVMIELSKQVEQNKLQVNKDTPVFSVIKEASIPVKRSSPKRSSMVLTYGFIGLLISISYVLSKAPVIKFLREVSG